MTATQSDIIYDNKSYYILSTVSTKKVKSDVFEDNYIFNQFNQFFFYFWQNFIITISFLILLERCKFDFIGLLVLQISKLLLHAMHSRPIVHTTHYGTDSITNLRATWELIQQNTKFASSLSSFLKKVYEMKITKLPMSSL